MKKHYREISQTKFKTSVQEPLTNVYKSLRKVQRVKLYCKSLGIGIF